jgi:hypothetical protein
VELHFHRVVPAAKDGGGGVTRPSATP